MSAPDQAPTARDWLLNYAGDSDWRTQVDRVLAQYRAEVLAEAAAHLRRQADELWAPGRTAHTVMHADADEVERLSLGGAR
ncbi:hypothetical protein ACFXA3_00555 [Streptomyces sp. NPDC059456]|uniref:hypothetical protein n=1 Tax=Streptomyces sp. NPDC059456 TaxID=3346838 RepID=UPI00367E76A6